MNHEAPPSQAILQMLMGPWVAQAIGAVARLGVADHFAGAPQTATRLAEAVGADVGALRRTMRALAGVGVFAPGEGDTWSLTPVGECLRTEVPGSMRYLAIAETDFAHWRTWERYIDAVRTGKPQGVAAVGCDPWEYYRSHPEDGEAFSKAMANISGMAIGPVLGAYDFSASKTIADIGGAFGALLAAILAANPGKSGILFDLPHVVKGADPVIGSLGGRVERIGGDFLTQVAPKADTYLLKHVLHDWDDATSVTILTNIRKSMSADARLLVIELVIPEPLAPSPAPLMDLNMLVALGGKERTAAEYGELFVAAGLATSRVIPTMSPYVILEARTA